MDGRSMQKVCVDLDGWLVELVRGQNVAHLEERDQRAILLLSQMDNPELPMEEFLRTLHLADR